MSQSRRISAADVMAGVDVVLGVAAAGLSLLLLTQYLGVYFTIWGSPNPTQGDADGYVITAIAALVVPTVGLTLAVIGKRKAAVISFLAVGALCLASCYLFAVPQGRWTPPPEGNNLPSDYRPCYGTSGYCPGG